LLGTITDLSALGLSPEILNSHLASSPNGEEANLRNLTSEEFYRDAVTDDLLPSRKLNPILGQYTSDGRLESVRTAPVLNEFEVAVASDGSILASGILSDEKVFNIHSGLLGTTGLEELLQVDLRNSTLLPISAH